MYFILSRDLKLTGNRQENFISSDEFHLQTPLTALKTVVFQF